MPPSLIATQDENGNWLLRLTTGRYWIYGTTYRIDYREIQYARSFDFDREISKAERYHEEYLLSAGAYPVKFFRSWERLFLVVLPDSHTQKVPWSQAMAFYSPNSRLTAYKAMLGKWPSDKRLGNWFDYTNRYYLGKINKGHYCPYTGVIRCGLK